MRGRNFLVLYRPVTEELPVKMMDNNMFYERGYEFWFEPKQPAQKLELKIVPPTLDELENVAAQLIATGLERYGFIRWRDGDWSVDIPEELT